MTEKTTVDQAFTRYQTDDEYAGLVQSMRTGGYWSDEPVRVLVLVQRTKRDSP